MGKYKYYKEERKNPYSKTNEYGKSVWWDIEKISFDAKDEKKPNRLSMSMCEYIKNKVWDGESGSNTSLETMYKRAQELYLKGIWSAAYLTYNDYTIEEAAKRNSID